MDIEDEDFDFGYVPTIANNSRSGSMKKIARKNDKKKETVKPKQQSNDFDLLE